MITMTRPKNQGAVCKKPVRARCTRSFPRSRSKNIPRQEEYIAQNDELFARVAKGDERARNELIKLNIPLVIYIATQHNMQFSLPDILSIGRMALDIAIDHYDPKRGNFGTYASFWIRQQFHLAIARGGTIVLTPQANYKRWKIGKTTEELGGELEREPTVEEISDASGFSPQVVRNTLMIPYTKLSLQQPLQDGLDTTVEDMLWDSEALSPCQSLELVDRHEWLETLLRKFNDRTRSIIVMRFGLSGEPPMILQDIAIKLNVSRERIRQILNRALYKLRQWASREMELCDGTQETPVATQQLDNHKTMEEDNL